MKTGISTGGYKMNNFTLERSSSKHPGICIMQDGKTTQDILPLLTFINICNDSRDLIDQKSAFMSFIANSFSTKEEFNKHTNMGIMYNEQLGDFVLQMKQRGLKITVPDPDYFIERYKAISKEVDSGRKKKIDGSKELAKEFYTTLEYSMNENIREARPHGIKMPDMPEKTKN